MTTAWTRSQHQNHVSYENSSFQRFAVQAWDPSDLGWLAGILDGEGCFCIVKRRPGRQNGNDRIQKFTSYNCTLTVGSIDFPIVAKCQEITRVGRITEAWKKNRVRKLHIWQASGWEARAVALIVHSRLVAKRAEADLLIGPSNEESWQRLREIHGRGDVYGSESI